MTLKTMASRSSGKSDLESGSKTGCINLMFGVKVSGITWVCHPNYVRCKGIIRVAESLQVIAERV